MERQQIDVTSDLNEKHQAARWAPRVAKGDRLERRPMFGQIDAAYYHRRAIEEREKANDADMREADKHRMRAALFEKSAKTLAGSVAAQGSGEKRSADRR